MGDFLSLHARVADSVVRVPTLADLPSPGVEGDIRWVDAEDSLYAYDGSAWIPASAGSGGVAPPDPAVSTNNAVARWDGTDASTLKNSTVVIDDSGNTTGIIINADGAGNSISNIENADIKAGAAIDATKIADGSVSSTEFQYLGGVTSDIQTQFSTVSGNISGVATDLNNHIVDTAGAHAASAISNSPSGNLAAADVQGALNELQTDVDSRVLKAGDTMTGFLTLSADGVNSLHAVTKQQLDAAMQGVDVKEGVSVATTADITLSGEQTIDGVLTSASRVLVKNQADLTQNGIYVSGAGAWSRATDADTGVELEGALVTVKSGSTNANTGWYQTSESITIGVTNIVFTQFFGAGTYTADGQGIELTGSTFSLELDGSSLSKSSSGLRVASEGIQNAHIATNAGIEYSKLANLTNDRALVSNGSGDVSVATTTATEIGYVNGVTSAIQTQINAKAATVTTTRGDLIRRGASADERFAAVTDNRVVRGDGTDVILGQIDDPDFFTTGAAAGATGNGIVINGTQTFGGNKTFNGSIEANGGFAANSNSYATGSVPGLVSTTTQTLAGLKSLTTGLTVGTTDLTSGALMQFTQSATGNTDYIAKFFKNDSTIASGEAGGIRMGVADNDFNNYKWITFNKSMTLTGDGSEIGYIGTNTDATAVAYVTASDKRMKTNIEPVVGALDTIMQITPVMYNWVGKENSIKQCGFLAQDLHPLFPDAVVAGDSGLEVEKMWAVEYGRITPLLVQALKDQQSLIESLRADLEDLKRKVP